MNRPDFRRRLLTESSTSDGATLYMVLEPSSLEDSVDTILVEVQNEQHLFSLIRSMRDERELASIKLFVNRAAAWKLAEMRINNREQENTPV